MKSVFTKLLVIIILILFSNNLQARINNYSSGQIITDYVEVSKKKKLKLPEGEWEVVERWSSAGHGLKFSVMGLIRVENNEVAEMMEIAYSNLAGAYIKYIDHALIEIMFKGKHDGCYERPEYYLVELYRKGSTHNCLIIDHIDVMKEINNPDDPQDRDILARTKQWLRDNSEVEVPAIMLGSFHSYFSRLVGGNWVGLSYSINPKLLNAPKNNYITEATSEYHKQNIQRFPEHKKIMEQWVSITAERHIEFENLSNSKGRHKLKLDKYILGNKVQLGSGNSISDKLKTLNELYKSGALTKEEFEKAKKKLLN